MRPKSKRQQNSINASSMADIAFLLLIFFLVSTSILQEQGLLVRLPIWEPNLETLALNEDKVFSVKINAKDELLIEKKASQLADVSQHLQSFLQDGASSPREKIVSLIHDRGSSYQRYIAVYDALLSAYKAVRNQQALQQYGKAYDLLPTAEKTSINRQIPMVISEAEPSDFEEKSEG